MKHILLAIVLSFGAGIVTQYTLDAALVRSVLKVKPWGLYHNITTEGRFRQAAIDYLMKGGKP
jgi:hypothetical protein